MKQWRAAVLIVCTLQSSACSIDHEEGHDSRASDAGALRDAGDDAGKALADAGVVEPVPGADRDDCDAAFEGGGCAEEGLECINEGCSDVCNWCTTYTCDSGAWIAGEIAPLECFGCGDELECEWHAQLCLVERPHGLEDRAEYSCVPLPSQCVDMPTCNCIAENGGFDSCDDDEGVVVTRGE